MAWRSSVPKDLAGRCRACWMRVHLCICHQIPRIETAIEVLIIRHAKERWSATNTGRIAALCLPNAKIVDYGVRDHPLGPLPLSQDACLLWPESQRTVPGTAPKQIVVLDGSWPQARHMLTRIEGLASLPRLALPAPSEPLMRLRRQRTDGRMSTLEAISELIGLYEGPNARSALRSIHDAMVAASLSARGLRTL